MKHIHTILILLICCCLCVSCRDNNNANYVISSDEYSFINKLSQYTEITYNPIATPVTEEEIRKAIESKIYSTAQTQIIEARNNVVIGDSVYVDYIISHEGKVQFVYNDIKLTVGEGTFDLDFEKHLVDSIRGITSYFNYVVKDPTSKLYNKTVQVEATVTKIYRVEEPILSDDYVSKHFDGSTIEELKKATTEELQVIHNAEDRIRNAHTILKLICNRSTFTINKDEFEGVKQSIIRNYTQIASLYDMELPQYVNEKMNMNSKEFENFCIQEAISQIEINLVIEAIAKSEQFIITDNGINNYAQKKNYTQFDLLKNKKLKEQLKYELTKDKVYDFILEMSTPNTINN